MTDEERLASLTHQADTLERRIQVLDQQIALHSPLYVPAYMIIGKEDDQTKLAKIQDELQELQVRVSSGQTSDIGGRVDLPFDSSTLGLDDEIQKHVTIMRGREVPPKVLLGLHGEPQYGFRADYYYVRAAVDGKLEKMIPKTRRVLITGAALAGKSRSIHHFITHKYPDVPIFIPRVGRISDFKTLISILEQAKSPIFPYRVWIFNDIDNAAKIPGFAKFIDQLFLSEYDIIIASCRTSKIQTVHSELGELFGYFEILAIPRLNDEEKSRLDTIAEDKSSKAV